MLVRSDLLAPSGGTSPPRVAILYGTSDPDTLLRVALYPDEAIVYCGLWLNDDLLLGWQDVAVVIEPGRIFTACRLAVSGRTEYEIEIRLLALWPVEKGEFGAAPSADAVIVSTSRKPIDRLRSTNTVDPRSLGSSPAQ